MSQTTEQSSGVNDPFSPPAGNPSISVTASTESGNPATGPAIVTSEVAAEPSADSTLPTSALPLIMPSDLLTRPVKIHTWSVTHALATPTILGVIDPWALFITTPTVVEKVKNAAYLRAELEVEIVTAASPAAYGLIDFSLFAQMTGLNPPAVPGFDRLVPQRSREMTVAHVDISQSNSVRFTIPWLWLYDYAALPLGPTGAWAIYMTALTPIATSVAGGSDSVVFTVYARLLPGYQLTVPRYQGKGRLESWKSHAGAASQKLGELAAGKPKTGPVSSVAATVGDVASKVKGLPVIGGAAAMVEMGATAVSNLAALFGYSRDVRDMGVTGVRTNALDNPAGTEINDHGLPVALVGTGALDPDNTHSYGPPEDPLSFPSLCARPTLVGIASMTSAMGVGSSVLALPVHPGYYWSESPVTQIDLPACGAAALPFAWWRGDMVYHMDIVAPQTARGTVVVTWQPPSSHVGDPTQVTQSKIIEVGGYHRYEFFVGFARERPYLPMFCMRHNTAIIPIGECNGQLSVSVVNPLQVTNPSNAAYFRVWVSMASNVDFRVLADRFVHFHADQRVEIPSFKSFYRMQGRYRRQSKNMLAQGDDSEFYPTQIVLVPPSGPYGSEALNFPGNGVLSARALVQKAFTYQIGENESESGSQWTFAHRIQMRGLLGTETEEGWPAGGEVGGFNYANYFSSFFCGWAGSQHVSMHAWGPAAVSASLMTLTQGETEAFNSHYNHDVGSVNDLGPHGANAFVIPYAAASRFYPNARASADWRSVIRQYIQLEVWPRAGSDVVVPYSPGDWPAYFRLYYSYGPDFRVSQFRQTPSIGVNTSRDTNSAYFWTPAP